jgi:hypothetical protein
MIHLVLRFENLMQALELGKQRLGRGISLHLENDQDFGDLEVELRKN